MVITAGFLTMLISERGVDGIVIVAVRVGAGVASAAAEVAPEVVQPGVILDGPTAIRAVEPWPAAADVSRVGMDEITESAAEDRERVLADFGEARAIVDESLTDLRRLMAEKLVGPMIADLHRRYRHTAMEGVERLFKQDLASLGETERDAVRRWAETLARRFAHLPSVGLRDLVFQAGPAAVEAFFSHAEPDLARELHEAAGRSGVALLIEEELEEA